MCICVQERTRVVMSDPTFNMSSEKLNRYRQSDEYKLRKHYKIYDPKYVFVAVPCFECGYPGCLPSHQSGLPDCDPAGGAMIGAQQALSIALI